MRQIIDLAKKHRRKVVAGVLSTVAIAAVVSGVSVLLYQHKDISRLEREVREKRAEIESMQTYMRFLIDRSKEDRAALTAEREMRQFFETNIQHAAKALDSALDDYYTAQWRIYELEEELKKE